MNAYLTSIKALSDETRLRIVGILQAGAFNVNELVGILSMGQSRVSRHLKILLDAGLVKARREGIWVYYCLADCWRERRSGRNGVPHPRYLRVLGHEIREQQKGGGSSNGGAFSNDDWASVEACLQRRRESANRFFQKVASDWDEHRDQVQGRPDYLEQLAERLGVVDTVVDLGTGTGVLLSRLSRLAKNVIGIDASSEMLEGARRSVAHEGITNVELRLGSVEHLPVPDGFADAMVANMVLHHVAHPPDALLEVRRGLRAGGRFILADLVPHDEESYREKLGDLWLGFSRGEVEHWLHEAGFCVDDVLQLPASVERPGAMIVSATSPAVTSPASKK